MLNVKYDKRIRSVTKAWGYIAAFTLLPYAILKTLWAWGATVGLTTKEAIQGVIGPLLFKYGAISVGIFWCYKKDFQSINGFNENMLMAEDADFAKRLKEWEKKNGKKYGTIQNGMLTSTRKFDKHGDWVLLKRPKMILAYLKGTDQKYADEAYYENQDR